MAIKIVEYDLADTFEPFPHEFNLVGLGARIACHPFRVCHAWVRRDPLVQSWLVGHLPLATFSSSPDQLPTTSRACLARRGGWLIWPRSRVIPPVSQSTNKLRKYRKRRSLPMERVRRLVGSANNSGFSARAPRAPLLLYIDEHGPPSIVAPTPMLAPSRGRRFLPAAHHSFLILPHRQNTAATTHILFFYAWAFGLLSVWKRASRRGQRRAQSHLPATPGNKNLEF